MKKGCTKEEMVDKLKIEKDERVVNAGQNI